MTEAKDKLVEYNAALLAICLMILLGFVDDVIELRWRDKVIVTLLGSYPLLVAYKGLTQVVVPKLLHGVIGSSIVDLNYLYYAWMCIFAIWCPNSINIYAGINGLEVGQSIVIGSFILVHNIIVSVSLLSHSLEQEMKLHISEEIFRNHLFSMTLMIPFLTTSLALLKHNSYPSRVFVGDTYCYFAGMTFAVVGVLGHQSKTILLLFIPQLFNFALSIP